MCPSLYRNDLGNLENVNKLSGNRGIKEQKVCMPFTLQGLPKTALFQNATGATVHWLNHHLPAPLVSPD